MNNSVNINELLEDVSLLSLDDQLLVSEIIRKRVVEERRKQIAESVKESREEYSSKKIKSGSVEDFIKDSENE